MAKAKYHGQESYNDYDVEMSYGQLQAIYRALERDHSDPLADELYAELGYYLQNVPGPGESEEEYKEGVQAQKEASGLAEPEMGEEGEAEGGRDMEQIGTELEGGEELEGAEPPAEAGGREPETEPEPALAPRAERPRERYQPARGNVGMPGLESQVRQDADQLLEAAEAYSFKPNPWYEQNRQF